MARPKSHQDTPPPNSLVQWLVQVMSDRIIEGRYEAGERLPESQLAGEFEVSRAPIREAFRILEHEGLITLSPRRGALVAGFDAKIINDIYECRRHLLALTVELATPNISQQDLAQLGRLLVKMESAVAAGENVQYFRLNVQFNDLIRSRCGNEILQQLVATLGKRVTRLRFISMSLPGRATISLEGNRRVVDAIAAGEAEKAGQLAGDLIESAREALLQHLQQAQAAAPEPRTA